MVSILQEIALIKRDWSYHALFLVVMFWFQWYILHFLESQTMGRIESPTDLLPNGKKRKSEKIEIPKLPKGKKMIDNVFNTDVDSLFKVSTIMSQNYVAFCW